MLQALSLKFKRFITPENIILLFILLSGLVVRLSFLKSIDGAITISDTPTYIGGAMNLYSHFWLSEYRPPVYLLGIIFMGVLFSWELLDKSIIVLQVLLGMVNVVILYKLTLQAFDKQLLAYITAFLVAINFKVYSWDFVILTENFSILVVTLYTYYLVLFLKYGNLKHIKSLTFLSLIAIFLKPFFLALPLATAVMFFFKYILFGDAGFKPAAIRLGTGFLVILLSVLAYSALNYAQNRHFGISTVGSVNTFGKILQYKMEDLGSNEKLIGDLKTAFKTEKPEYIVDGTYLEPWHFIGTYGWAKSHYKEIADFSKEIILKHPVRYFAESIRLSFELLVLNSPFRDFIADAAVNKANHPDRLMLLIRKFTGIIDMLSPLLVLGIGETVFFLLFKRKQKAVGKKYLPAAILCVIVYHYTISAFLSYGDYCRLLAPCYPLIYVVICLYVYRVSAALLTPILKKLRSGLSG